MDVKSFIVVYSRRIFQGNLHSSSPRIARACIYMHTLDEGLTKAPKRRLRWLFCWSMRSMLLERIIYIRSYIALHQIKICTQYMYIYIHTNRRRRPPPPSIRNIQWATKGPSNLFGSRELRYQSIWLRRALLLPASFHGDATSPRDMMKEEKKKYIK
jgi:hypothetical protein